jgi:hypothetical protein
MDICDFWFMKILTYKGKQSTNDVLFYGNLKVSTISITLFQCHLYQQAD